MRFSTVVVEIQYAIFHYLKQKNRQLTANGKCWIQTNKDLAPKILAGEIMRVDEQLVAIIL